MDQAGQVTGIVARRLTILGRVQGVFYRNWTVETARGLGLAGWCRNRVDGSVEVWIEGAPTAVERFAALAAEGPPAAQVTHIQSMDAEPEGSATFEKRTTA